ncbi:YbaB/EbfC family nucleoid-associated protein [Sphaerisporangium sp. B11E5]|uniref:YbaB/EbfC family nucleoid-associated protein n=1 Tax=Sphaerisporangium sp. B11E5 TaxID=3153563 RepID=UPI00325F3CB4
MTWRGEPFSPTGDPEVDQVLETLAVQTAQFEEVGRRLSATLGRGEAEDGRVVVEVRTGGSLASLRIDPRALTLGPEALSAAILRAAKEAETNVANRAEAVMRPLLGEDKPRAPTDD